jgi:BirA family biotin operon repressor/biotin-[acetyl-CoA-carboxylase] ligase
VASLTLDDVPAKQLAQRWGVPQAGVFRRLGSTFDAIHDLGAQGAPHGTVVLADEQTAGRGRDGRTWQSPVGGVWLGVLLRPSRAELGAVSLRIGLVVADVVDELARRPAAQLKWPNDVLCDDRKLAGILCEGRWQGDALQWLAVGVGINVANEIPSAVRATAVALAEIVPGVRRIDVLDRLVPALPQVTTHSGVLTESESAAFAARDWLRGRLLRAPVYGRACGVRADGALLVEGQGGTIGVREGHVELA